MIETTVQGLYLAPPHGQLIAEGLKSSIAKARPMGLEGEWILLSGDKAYGHIRVGQPKAVDIEDFKARRDEHGVSEKERLRWWPETSPLYLYPIEQFQPYPSGPVKVSLPSGVQTRVDTKGLGLPASDIDAVIENDRQRVRILSNGRKVIVMGAIPRRSKKSLTAIVLSVEETEDGPVAIYGLPITDGDNSHALDLGEKAGKGRWRTLKDGRHVLVTTSRHISRAAMTRAVEDIQKVIEKGKATGMEYATAFDRDGNPTHEMVGGEDASQAHIGALTNAGPNEFVMVHNHPSSGAPSGEDMATLFTTDLEHIVVAGHDGTVYRVSRTDRTASNAQMVELAVLFNDAPTYKETRRVHPEMSQKVYQDLVIYQYLSGSYMDRAKREKPAYMKRIQAGRIDKAAALKHLTHGIVNKMAKAYGLEYERILPDG